MPTHATRYDSSDSDSSDEGSPAASAVIASTYSISHPVLTPLTLKEDEQPQLLPVPHVLHIGDSGRAACASGGGGRGGTPRIQPHTDVLLDTKRKLVLHNATIGPIRCAEEHVVVQRFGEHLSRIPTPPTVQEPMHMADSKEERHQHNRLRLYGSVDNMNRSVAGGIGTVERISHKTILCNRGLSSSASARSTQCSGGGGSVTPRKQLHLNYEPNLRQAFTDLTFLEQQKLASYLHTDADVPQQPQSAKGDDQTSPRRLVSRSGRETGNNFFLISRASHRDRVMQSSMSARGDTAMGGGGTRTVLPHITSPRIPTQESLPSKQHSSTTNAKRRHARDDDSLAQEPDEFVEEDTAFVVAETKKFERTSLSRAKRNITFDASSISNISAVRAEVHTSDLLKMIFNARIASECEVAAQLRRLGEKEGVEKLIADALSTAQRLALRTAGVNDFHLFLCNLLRDPDLSFSESRVIFGAIDSNHSGVIDQSELCDGLRLLLLDETELILTFAKKVFTEVGRHKDTRLSFLEVQAIFFAALDFFEVDFDPLQVVEAAGLNPKKGPRTFDDDKELAGGLTPVVSANQLQHQPKMRAPRMFRTNTLTPSPTASPTVDANASSPRNKDPLLAGAVIATAKAPLRKPTMDGLKKRMVDECSVALREVWKYSQSGQIVVPLLRSLTTQVAGLLHAALCQVPVQHFNLKRSGFWKAMLAAEELKYQQHVEHKTLEADLLKATLGKMVEEGGPPSPRSKQQLINSSRRSSTAATGVVSGISGSIILKDVPVPTTTDAGLASPNILSRAGSISGAAGAKYGGRRQSRDVLNAQQLSLAGLQPISYEEYEEACGDTVNIASLQAQLKDGSVRLSQAQRALIAQQIEQGRAAMTRSTSHRKSVSSFAQPGGGAATIARRDRSVSRVKSPDLSKKEDSAENNTPRDDAFLQALQRRKSEGSSKNMRGTQSAFSGTVDLNEVIDPFHPRFHADHDKVSDTTRQHGASEHNAPRYFSKQGNLFTMSPNGIIAPYEAKEAA